MTAKELLTAIQLFGANPTSNYEYLEKIKHEKISLINQAIIDRITTTYNRMPTEYQDSHFYDMIEEAFSILKATVENTNLKFGGRSVKSKPVPLFGTVDFNDYNAFVRTTDEATVIVFNEGLLKFMQRMIGIYVIEHWLAAHNSMTPYLQKIITQNFIDVMLCYYLFSDAYAAIPLELCEISDLNDLNDLDKFSSSFDMYFGNEEYLSFEDEITTSAYLWIAAHEYSHIVLNHLNGNNTTTKLHLANVDVDKVGLSQKQELDADLLGAIIVMESETSLFSANGIYLSLNCLLLSGLDKHQLSSSHPPVKERIKNVFNNITSYTVSNYSNIDRVFVPKYEAFKKTLNYIHNNDIVFSSIDEMQRYIYKGTQK